MTELAARNHRVLYVDYQYTAKDVAKAVWGRETLPVGRVLRLQDPLLIKSVENGGELYVWNPAPMLPINWLSANLHDRLHAWNSRRMLRGLRQTMKRLGMQKPLIINAFNPVYGLSMLSRLNEWATIYYCFDEITANGWSGRHGSRYEQQYLRRVDAVVTTSETLRRAKETIQPRTFCVKNGVNFDLFHQAQQVVRPAPESRPIIGYLGTADNRIDLRLVAHCVQAMPDVDFQFIGKLDDAAILQQLGGCPNVQFIPPLAPAELPALLGRMSAAMIPFTRNEHTYTIYPLKINEYLAAGLPVVSTNFSILDDFDGVIERADQPDDFVAALRRALVDNSSARVTERIQMARNNTWAKRAEEFERVISQI